VRVESDYKGMVIFMEYSYLKRFSDQCHKAQKAIKKEARSPLGR
jgi:hypothetical protein